MNCLECRGACCETFELPTRALTNDDASRWFALHGTEVGRSLVFECRCTKLSAEGRCTIYEQRPGVCRKYEAGGPDCLRTVKARRTSEQYRLIREAQDPEEL